jgi:putative endopeptidase
MGCFAALFIVTNPQFLELLNNWASSKSLSDWAFMVKSMVLISLARLLPEPFEALHFDFFNRFLGGQKKPYPLDQRVFAICDEVCPDLLGQLYVKTDHANFKRIRHSASELCQTIITATKRCVDRLNWISEGSKTIAKDKIDNMGIKIAYPDNWLDELAGVKVDPSCFLMNLLMARKQATLQENRCLTGLSTVDRRRWSNPCYSVNAYYYADINELCIPLGFLQPPFFSLQASYIKNLAGLGNIVGHEISHGFDEEGHKYDHKGNYAPWWTSMDVEMYKTRTRQLIDVYNKETYFGIQIDGMLTLGENLADFGAVAIGIDVIKRRGNRIEELREYFIEYAKSWASKERSAKRERDIKTDVHPPAQLRVNVVLKHFDAFYEAFGFQAAEPGFVPAEERIDVWGR